MDEITADLSTSYLDYLGVRQLIRRFIYLRPAVIVIHDYVELDAERTIEWNIHSYGKFRKMAEQPELQFEITDNFHSAFLYCIMPQQVTWETGLSPFVPAYPNPGMRDRYLTISKQSKTANFLCILTLDDSKVNWTLDSERSWQQLLV